MKSKGDCKKVLFIDPIFQKGHVGFNQIYIKSLQEQKADIDYIFVKGYEEEIHIDKERIIYLSPSFHKKGNRFDSILNRIAYVITLFLLRYKVRFSDYDLILFSSFEEISFYFSGIRNVCLINHINANKSTKSSIKRFFLKKVLQYNTCIVFDEITKKYLETLGGMNLIVKPHGLFNPVSSKNAKKNLDYNLNNKDYDYMIFSPSSNSSDYLFIKEVINNSSFVTFLENHRILMVLKGNYESKSKNVVVIDYYLSQEAYYNLFTRSNLILIAYPESFKYRTSGVLFECFANNKPCLVKSNGLIKPYSQHFLYDASFDSTEGLIKRIRFLKVNCQKKCFYKDLKLLTPDLKDLIYA